MGNKRRRAYSSIRYALLLLKLSHLPLTKRGSGYEPLLNRDKNGSNSPAEEIVSTEGVVEFAGDESQPIIFFGLESRVDVFLGDEFRFAHFVGVGQTPRLDLNLVAVFQCFQVREDARLIVHIPNMAGDDRVACPGGEGGASQITGAVAEPGNVPAIFALRHADDGHGHVEFGYFEQHSCVGVGFGGWLFGEQGDDSMSEAGFGQVRGRGGDGVAFSRKIGCGDIPSIIHNAVESIEVKIQAKRAIAADAVDRHRDRRPDGC